MVAYMIYTGDGYEMTVQAITTNEHIAEVMCEQDKTLTYEEVPFLETLPKIVPIYVRRGTFQLRRDAEVRYWSYEVWNYDEAAASEAEECPLGGARSIMVRGTNYEKVTQLFEELAIERFGKVTHR